MTKSAAITRSPPARGELAPWQEQDWQKLWLATRERDRAWRSLALIPAGPGTAPELMLQIAVTLAHTGMSHLGGSIHVADGTRLRLVDLIDFSEEIAHCTKGSDLVLIVLAAVIDNVTTVSIAQSADCALLCVVREQMKTAHAKKTVDEIGAAKFIGSVLFSTPTE